MAQEHEENRREFFRLAFSPCLLGQLTILRESSDVALVDDHDIGIVDISACGIHIHTNLDLGDTTTAVYYISFNLLGQRHIIPGRLIRRTGMGPHVYGYVTKSLLDIPETEKIVRLLNQAHMRNRKPSTQLCYTPYMEKVSPI